MTKDEIIKEIKNNVVAIGDIQLKGTPDNYADIRKYDIDIYFTVGSIANIKIGTQSILVHKESSSEEQAFYVGAARRNFSEKTQELTIDKCIDWINSCDEYDGYEYSFCGLDDIGDGKKGFVFCFNCLSNNTDILCKCFVFHNGEMKSYKYSKKC